MREPADQARQVLARVAAIQRDELARSSVLRRARVGVEQRLARPRSRPWLALPIVGAAAVAMAVLVARSVEPSLSFVAGAAEGRVGELLVAQRTALPVRFSDGSRLVLAPAARMRVAHLDSHGAEVTLEGGQVEVEVAHRPLGRWVLNAGAYAVTVTGTAFTMSWQGGGAGLVVAMRSGSVEVTGPVGWGPARRVNAGQVLRASARGDEARVDDVGGVRAGVLDQAPPAPADVPGPPLGRPGEAETVAPRAPADAGALSHSAAQGPAAPPPRRSAGETGRSEGRRPAATGDASWRQLAAQARYQAALTAAEKVGYDLVCAGADAEGLMMLGDAARLAGNARRAEQAYLAARRRFPSLDRSAFALGLTAFERRRDYSGAATWFQTYLRDHPNGALAREASGRLLESLVRAGEEGRAVQVARDYLSRYPAGPHASLARQTIGR